MPAYLFHVGEERLVKRDKFVPKDPEYIILSHRWDGKEIEFFDLIPVDDSRRMIKEEIKHSKRASWEKLQGTCKQAEKDHIDWIWIDTFCIDKRNYADYSEEINSMYRYYSEAKICYAYLPQGEMMKKVPELPIRKNPPFEDFNDHDWFQRGWTLQELVAPREMKFFTQCKCENHEDWQLLGHKAGPSEPLTEPLSAITGIDEDILDHSTNVLSVSVAKRMSWAAKRTTGRLEDRAYSLMGIFNVNMPVNYGEGEEGAFMRLQEKIMKQSTDESLFAWSPPDAEVNKGKSAEAHKNESVDAWGLLAKSPDMFTDSGDLFAYYDWESRTPFLNTNQGLRITLPLKRYGNSPSMFLATLNCLANRRGDKYVAILLERVTVSESLHREPEQYVRLPTRRLLEVNTAEDRGTMTTIYVRSSRPQRSHVLQIRKAEKTSGCSVHATMGIPASSSLQFPSQDRIDKKLHSAFQMHKQRGRLAAVVTFSGRKKFTVLLGSLSDMGDVGVVIVDDSSTLYFEEWQERFQREGPRPSGTPTKVGSYTLQVNVNERIYEDTKYFVASVTVSR